jgi:hypothetical protein
VSSLEQYLLDCISDLQRAGDDAGRRKRAINKSDTWDLLNKNWKALAVLAAEKTAPKTVDKDGMEINKIILSIVAIGIELEEEAVDKVEWV